MSTIREYIKSMTAERVLSLAARPQGFSVHRYRHRDEAAAKIVQKLAQAGKIKCVRKDRTSCTYRIRGGYDTRHVATQDEAE